MLEFCWTYFTVEVVLVVTIIELLLILSQALSVWVNKPPDHLFKVYHFLPSPSLPFPPQNLHENNKTENLCTLVWNITFWCLKRYLLLFEMLLFLLLLLLLFFSLLFFLTVPFCCLKCYFFCLKRYCLLFEMLLFLFETLLFVVWNVTFFFLFFFNCYFWLFKMLLF